jgi:glycolate oxidase FAD binding subunit
MADPEAHRIASRREKDRAMSALYHWGWVVYSNRLPDISQMPASPEALAAALADASSRNQSVALAGANSKARFGGPIPDADVAVSTVAMTRVLNYEPRDLTISVEAGIPWRDLTTLLAKDRLMIPLDPPFAGRATAGGVVSANLSGPRRRLYGSARDLVIGMMFATIDGKLIQSGGMVVKNVAGLDMGKLMIGSYGTLAAIAIVNFKLIPIPPVERRFALSFPNADAAAAAMRAIRLGVLQPQSLDLLNPAAALMLGLDGWTALIDTGGNEAVIERYARELAAIAPCAPTSSSTVDAAERFLDANPSGAIVRLSSAIADVPAMTASTEAPAIGRAGNGVTHVYVQSISAAADVLRGKPGVIEACNETDKLTASLWPAPSSDFAIMKRIKLMLDPHNRLNRGRYFNQL